MKNHCNARTLLIIAALYTAPFHANTVQGDPVILYDSLYLFDDDLIDGGVGNAIGGKEALPSLGTIDSQVADDFTTTDDYLITRVVRDFNSFLGTVPAEGIRVQFYLDENSKPAEDVFADVTLLPGEFEAIDLGMLNNFQSWRLDMDLTGKGVHLPADTWWIDVQPLDIDTTGDWFWSMRSIITPLGLPTHVRDGWEEHGNDYYGLWGSTDWIELDFRGNGALSMRIEGEPQAGDCLRLKFDRLVAGLPTEFTITGGTPGERGVLVYGFQLGQTVLKDYAGFCATFGIKGLKQNRVIGGLKNTFDNTGTININQFIPAPAVGLTIHFQAAAHDTCPDECISTIVTGVVL